MESFCSNHTSIVKVANNPEHFREASSFSFVNDSRGFKISKSIEHFREEASSSSSLNLDWKRQRVSTIGDYHCVFKIGQMSHPYDFVGPSNVSDNERQKQLEDLNLQEEDK
ncbi:hypothetical protein RJT34_00364 [Clitoria ternatea]|uniref:Uncharacterized protein n=1 Tax=Clitoria ternatea TaxID=43366 RepID=A0AAN9KHW4_CLITE